MYPRSEPSSSQVVRAPPADACGLASLPHAVKGAGRANGAGSNQQYHRLLVGTSIHRLLAKEGNTL